MKHLKTLLTVCLIIIGTNGCELDLVPDTGKSDSSGSLQTMKLKASKARTTKATGLVELVWKGANKGSDMGNKPDDLLTFMDLNAFEGNEFSPPKGEIVYRVLESDSSLHREIIADVYAVYIGFEQEKKKAWIVASVIYDSKGCGGNGSGGHDSGCSDGSHNDPDGGCSGDDSSHDGGCSHDDTGGDGGSPPDGTGEDGGCSHDDTGEDGGCSHDDTGEDGGCSHDDTGGDGGSPPDGTGGDGGSPPDGTGEDGGCSHDDTGEDGGCSHDDTGEDGGGCPDGGTGGDDHSGGGGDKGNPLSGKNCRLGQVIAIKLHDGGTPAVNGDGITWKWFDPNAAFVPGMENIEIWPHLCKKTILAGNLVIHDN